MAAELMMSVYLPPKKGWDKKVYTEEEAEMKKGSADAFNSLVHITESLWGLNELTHVLSM